MRRTGAQIVWEMLKREGVEVVFGIPGGAIMHVYHPRRDYGIHHVLVRHEQCAAHAADGYARASGRVGVAIATSGPGATNLVTGIATAMMDSSPIVCITGQVPTSVIGFDAFQEIDITGITLPITKHNYLVTDVNDLAYIIHEAFYIARSGRPGPVLIDIPKDIQKAETDFVPPEEEVRLPGYRPVGPGDPLALGMMGMHGEVFVNQAIQEADLLLAFGMRFDDRVTGRLEHYAPKSRKVHVDLDAAELNKIVPVDVAILGDLRQVLEQLLPLVEPASHREWLEQINRWREESRARDIVHRPSNGRLLAPQVVHAIWEATGGEAIVATDVGQNQMWAAQYYHLNRPHTLMTSGGLGTMGFGLPAAIGAQVAHPDKEVWAFVGDGGFQMTMQELATVVQERLPLRIALLNNGYLGMVRQWQEFFYDQRYESTSLLNPDFVRLVEAYGIRSWRVTTPEETHQAIAEARSHPGPAFIEFQVAQEGEEGNVYPMVPAGAALHEMIRRPTPAVKAR